MTLVLHRFKALSFPAHFEILDYIARFYFQIALRMEGEAVAPNEKGEHVRQMSQKYSHLKKKLYFLPKYPQNFQ